MVRYFGEPVAAVAAGDLETAKAALGQIRIDYAPLPAAVGYDASRAPGAVRSPRILKSAPGVGEGDGVPAPWRKPPRPSAPSRRNRARPGDDRRCAAPVDPLLVEGTWRTEAQCHTSSSPTLRSPAGDRLVVTSPRPRPTSRAALPRLRFGRHRSASCRARRRRPAQDWRHGRDDVAAVPAGAGRQGCPRRLDRHELSAAGYRPGAEMAVALLPSASGGLKASIKATADTGVGISSAIAMLGRMIYGRGRLLTTTRSATWRPPRSAVRADRSRARPEQAVDGRRPPEGRPHRPAAALGRRRQPPALYAWAAQLPVWRDRRADRHAGRPLPPWRRRRRGELALICGIQVPRSSLPFAAGASSPAWRWDM